MEADVAAFAARVRSEVEGLVARERVVVEAAAVVDRAWAGVWEERE